MVITINYVRQPAAGQAKRCRREICIKIIVKNYVGILVLFYYSEYDYLFIIIQLSNFNCLSLIVILNSVLI